MKNILISAFLFIAIPAFAQVQKGTDCTVSAGDIVINASKVKAIWYCPKAAMGASPSPYLCARMEGSNETIPMHSDNPDAALKIIADAMKRCQ